MSACGTSADVHDSGPAAFLSGFLPPPRFSVAHCLQGYIESAEHSRMAEQNKISKLTVKLQIISTEHGCGM